MVLIIFVSFFDSFENEVIAVLVLLMLALSPVAGFVSMLVSKNKQRFGDMIAGTTVVSLKNNPLLLQHLSLVF